MIKKFALLTSKNKTSHSTVQPECGTRLRHQRTWNKDSMDIRFSNVLKHSPAMRWKILRQITRRSNNFFFQWRHKQAFLQQLSPLVVPWEAKWDSCFSSYSPNSNRLDTWTPLPLLMLLLMLNIGLNTWSPRPFLLALLPLLLLNTKTGTGLDAHWHGFSRFCSDWGPIPKHKIKLYILIFTKSWLIFLSRIVPLPKVSMAFKHLISHKPYSSPSIVSLFKMIILLHCMYIYMVIKSNTTMLSPNYIGGRLHVSYLVNEHYQL